MKSFFCKAAKIILPALYPVFIYFGLKHFEARYVGALIGVLVGLKLLSSKKRLKDFNIKPLLPAVLLFMVFLLLSLIFNHPAMVKIYPVLVSLFFFLLFSFSLYKPPSIVEKFARITQPDLTPKAILYTRKVTLVWCCFFILNGLISLYTVFYASLEAWAVYNGMISYMLMGILFTAEYIIRISLLKGEKI